MKDTNETTNEIAIVNNEIVENLIYIIRNQKVMLDVDLARIYGYETKYFNRQVKNNIDRFDNDFMFQLTREEVELVRCKNFTSRNENLFAGQGGGTRYLPYAFTEQGIYMLMSVLKSELAIMQSKALIRIFKGMKDYIAEKHVLIGTDDIVKLAMQTSENTAAIAQIDKIISEEMLRKSDLPKIFKSFTSTETGKEFLIMIFSDNKRSHLISTDLNDFKTEFPNIKIDFRKTNKTMHDRYIILDYGKRSEKIYHCGASSKDAGKTTTTITEVHDKTIYKPLIDGLLGNPALIIK